jgi:hypothetical protein
VVLILLLHAYKLLYDTSLKLEIVKKSSTFVCSCRADEDFGTFTAIIRGLAKKNNLQTAFSHDFMTLCELVSAVSLEKLM